MKALLIILAAIVVLVGVCLFIRFRYYKNWSTFFDDLGEQVMLDFIPGPLKVIIIGGLIVWGAASFVGLFTKEIRAKAPDPAQAAPAAPSVEQLAQAAKDAKLPESLPMPVPAPSSGDMQSLAAALRPPPPPPPVADPQMPTPEQLAELSRQLEEMQRQQQNLAKATPTPSSIADVRKAIKSELEKNARSKRPAQVQVTPVPEPVLVATNPIEAQVLAAMKNPGILRAGRAHGLAPSVAFTTWRPSPVPENEMSEVERNRKILREFPLVVKNRGGWFEGKLVHKRSEKQLFLRPEGDIVGIPQDRIAQVIDGPVKWPLER